MALERNLTIVCLHGLGRSASDWDAVRPALERYGEVHAPDLPPEGLAGSALPTPAVLIGHSMGAMVALRRAAAEPAGVAGLIVSDGFFPPALNGRSRSATLADYGRHRLALVSELAARGARPRRGAARGMGSLARLGLRPEAFHVIASRVRAPVLVVHARDDHHVPVDFAMAAAARHPSWTLELLAGGGHAPHVERPAEWLRPVGRWLEQRAA